MSLVETQEIMATMKEILALLDASEVKVKDVTEKVTGKSGGGVGEELSLRREMHIMNMYMVAMQRFSGSDNISQIVNKIQSVTMAAIRLQMLLRSIQVIQTALAASLAVTPWGWAMLGANAIGLGMSLSTLGQ